MRYQSTDILLLVLILIGFVIFVHTTEQFIDALLVLVELIDLSTFN
jgi:hypothetical protein